MKYKGTLVVVKDCRKSLEFYKNIFGLELIQDNDGNMELSCGIFLQESDCWKKFIGQEIVKQSNSSELYFEEPDIDSFVTRLEQLYPDTKYVNKLMTHSWGQRVVRFYDPDGNLIEVGTPLNSIIDELTDNDDKKAYEKVKEIVSISKSSSMYYAYLDTFASFLNDEKSYVRTRAFILCCSQARWDDGEKLKQLLPSLLVLFHDKKPTVVRQCLTAVREIIVSRPELNEIINAELNKIDFSWYKESMANLIRDDIAGLRELIKETTKSQRH